MIRLRPVPILGDNYVWCLDSESRAVVVDPGEAGPVVAALDAWELDLTAVLITHHHGDHTAGIGALLERWSVPVYGPASERIPHMTDSVADGDRVALDELGVELEVFEVPGHTAGHVAYVGHGFVLTGDTLFAGGCGRLFEGTPKQMVASLRRLMKLPPATEVYCAHEYTLANLSFGREVEPDNEDLAARLEDCRRLRADGHPTLPSTVDEELRTNVFLRGRQPSVKAAAETHVGHSLDDEVAVFAAVRRWKDGWRG